MYHILFIDDDDMLLESAWRFFKGINYQMDKAANAKEGLKECSHVAMTASFWI